MKPLNSIIFNELYSNLKEQESFSSIKYLCSEGIETIGYGKTKSSIRKEQLTWLGVSSWDDIVEVSEAQADRLLREDIEYFHTACENKFDWFRYQQLSVKYVVINICFNIGVSGFSKFENTIELIKKRANHEASVEMLDSKWFEDVKGRALRLSKIMACGHFDVPSIGLCREEYRIFRKRVK